MLLWPFALFAEGLRVATFHAELTRKGPGLLLRDILRGADPQLDAIAALVADVRPEILLVTKVDFDADMRTAKALQEFLGFEHAFALPPNSMRPSAFDFDGDARIGDRHAWARYAGEGAMLLLSNHPISLRFHLNDVLWVEAAPVLMPTRADGSAFLTQAAAEALKLVSQGLWVVDVNPAKQRPITLVLFQNQTPVFDGPEDLNGLRNHAQLGLLSAIMDGSYGSFPLARFALIGNANLDPMRGQGVNAAIATLLRDPRLQNPAPRSETGDDATVVWEKVGPMRVSYILPSQDWQIGGTEIVWPVSGPLRQAAEQASRHRLIWMDLKSPP